MTDIKRILILTADAASGHHSAANAIALALQATYGERCKVEIANALDDERVPSVLYESRTDYDRLVREMPEIYRLRYQISDSAIPSTILESIVTVMLYRVIQDLVQRYEPDAIIVTHPTVLAAVGAVIALGKVNIPLFTVMTDLSQTHRLWFNPAADMLMAPGNLARQAAVESGFPVEKIELTGIPVHPALVNEPRSKQEIRAGLGWRPDLTTVLVVGGRRVKNLENVLHVLDHSGLPLQYILVAGGDDGWFVRLKADQWHSVAHLDHSVEITPACLRAADLVICKADSLIVTEALACGLPMLLVDVIPGQEEGNAEYVIKNGAGLIAQTPIDALEIVFHWLNNDQKLLLETARAAGKMGKPQAAFAVANLVWSIIERGPLPVPESRLSLLPKLRDLLKQFGVLGSGPSSSDEPQVV